MPLRFGKLAAKHDERTLRLKTYLHPALPAPPPAYNAFDRIAFNLGTKDVAALFPMDGNDQYGDCTIAAKAHALTLYNGFLGNKFVPSEADVVKTYLGLSGGEDSGLVMLDVMKEWKKNGLLGHNIDGFVSVDEDDVENVKKAIFMFGGVDIGFRVQRNCISDFQAGKLWQPGKTDGSGHDVYAFAYAPDRVGVFTWGSIAWGSWEWFTTMVDEAFVVLPDEAEKKGFTPGFDFAMLQKDIQILAA